MKNICVILLVALWMTVGGCSAYYISGKQVMAVQQGMSFRNVEKILGKPDYRRFEGESEEWEYHRVASSKGTGYSIKVIVRFEDGRVISMDTFDADEILLPSPVVVMH